MLPQRCPNCVCLEEAGMSLRFQMRLQRTIRVLNVAIVLLLGIALGTLVLLLFGSPLSRQCEQPEITNARTAPEAVSEKQSIVSIPSAQLTIKNKAPVEWQEVHIEGGMSYDSGNLGVPSNGLYRVYLQITFQFQNNSNLCGNGFLNLYISVKNLGDRYPNPIPLMKSEDTMSCRHGWTKSMILSGTFELEAKSQLQADFNIHHLPLIRVHETYTFFGAYLISNHFSTL